MTEAEVEDLRRRLRIAESILINPSRWMKWCDEQMLAENERLRARVKELEEAGASLARADERIAELTVELRRLRALRDAMLAHGGWDRKTSPGARLMDAIDAERAAASEAKGEP
jgi:hypothetical protein